MIEEGEIKIKKSCANDPSWYLLFLVTKYLARKWHAINQIPKQEFEMVPFLMTGNITGNTNSTSRFSESYSFAYII